MKKHMDTRDIGIMLIRELHKMKLSKAVAIDAEDCVRTALMRWINDGCNEYRKVHEEWFASIFEASKAVKINCFNSKKVAMYLLKKVIEGMRGNKYMTYVLGYSYDYIDSIHEVDIKDESIIALGATIKRVAEEVHSENCVAKNYYR